MEKIFGEVLSMSVNSAWLIIAVIICRAFLQKAPRYISKILWALVGLRLVVPFSIKSALSLIPHETQQTTSQAIGQVVSAPAQAGVSVATVVPMVWVIVGVLFLTYGIASYIRLRFKVFDAVLLSANVYQSEKVDSPFVCGFVKPKIYLPYGLDAVTQSCVLKHENVHIKNMDHIIKAVGFCILCLHWFNPLVWLTYFLLCKDIELACDESVIRNYNEADCKQYAKALLDLGVNKVKLSACPVAFGEVSIKKRIKSVVAYKRAGRVLVSISLFLCAFIAVCFMTDPKIKAKDNINIPERVENIVVEATTEPATEAQPVENTTTEPDTTQAPAVTENTQQQTVLHTEAVEQTEEAFDDSVFENEEDGLDESSLGRINIAGPEVDMDVAEDQKPPYISSNNSYTSGDYSSLSGVVGTKPSDILQETIIMFY